MCEIFTSACSTEFLSNMLMGDIGKQLGAFSSKMLYEHAWTVSIRERCRALLQENIELFLISDLGMQCTAESPCSHFFMNFILMENTRMVLSVVSY